MYISRKFTGMVIIALLLAAATFNGAVRAPTIIATLFAFGIMLIVAFIVINWVGNEPKQQTQSRRKVERMLRELDDDDLDLLRHRLMQDEREEEYGSMADLVQSGKRKNEIR